jgi:hypothetical protein
MKDNMNAMHLKSEKYTCKTLHTPWRTVAAFIISEVDMSACTIRCMGRIYIHTYKYIWTYWARKGQTTLPRLPTLLPSQEPSLVLIRLLYKIFKIENKYKEEEVGIWITHPAFVYSLRALNPLLSVRTIIINTWDKVWNWKMSRKEGGRKRRVERCTHFIDWCKRGEEWKRKGFKK